ncbi:RagB/SusD domain-containing protein [Mucilaginibacter pineti]|uniref:RagB/SusD domain-containing protein n=1 Tax=Mucilaginibacter pineti TaxID=1391627 RepID=A0A1G7IJS4_9SPHI|nr:RagB/SusD family nutrient uptake outer membrane protein [Mucilaginibacter pineti]SDF12776.1 RagB/SusD domain-containing protein [Mucilaginibacter pineti]
MKKKLNTIKHILFTLSGLALFSGLVSCKKFVDISAPQTRLVQDNVYAVDATAAGVLTGIYTGLNLGSPATGQSGISLRAGLSSDELTYQQQSFNTQLEGFYLNALNASATDAVLWRDSYRYINIANTALEGLNSSTTLTPAVKQQLTGEALFLRAFLHFYLVNLFGDVPLVTSSDYRINNSISRSPTQAVYEQILSDLKAAQGLLSTDYRAANITTATLDRVRPNQAAASALLARVYLYLGDWANAEIQSGTLISNTSTYSLTALNNVFLTESREAIWQLAGVDENLNTLEGQLFILNGPPDYDHPVSLSNTLLQSFEPSDRRKTDWIGHLDDNGTEYYYPNKYKVSFGTPVTEQLTVLRLAEQYLIRAEARAQLGKLSQSRDDLNAVRSRAGLLPTAENDQQNLLKLIYHERQVELFTEWGHRWLDLKRTGTADAVMTTASTAKGTSWKTTAQLYPIPQTDIDRDANLKQNSGY